jgi:MYXO-CTERM domain-containing protein
MSDGDTPEAVLALFGPLILTAATRRKRRRRKHHQTQASKAA